MIQVEGDLVPRVRLDGSAAVRAGQTLASTDDLSVFRAPPATADSTNLQAEALRDLRAALPFVHEHPVRVEVELLRRRLEDRREDLVVLRDAPDDEMPAALRVDDDARRLVRRGAVEELHREFAIVLHRALQPRRVLLYVGREEVEALRLLTVVAKLLGG